MGTHFLLQPLPLHTVAVSGVMISGLEKVQGGKKKAKATGRGEGRNPR